MRMTPMCTCTSGSLANSCRIPVRKTKLQFLNLNRACTALMMEAASAPETLVNLLATTSIYSRARPSDQTHERNYSFERLSVNGDNGALARSPARLSNETRKLNECERTLCLWTVSLKTIDNLYTVMQSVITHWVLCLKPHGFISQHYNWLFPGLMD
jgi:hypothetical protein